MMKFDTFHSFQKLSHVTKLVVPWEVVGEQVVKRYSVMDLGQDSPVLCLHCHPPFCSKSICTTETSQTSFE